MDTLVRKTNGDSVRARAARANAAQFRAALASVPDTPTRPGDENFMRFEIDALNPPKLTAKQEAEIAALLDKCDADFDYSETPPIDDAFVRTAVRNPFTD